MSLTPLQRRDLVTNAFEKFGRLSMLLVPVTSHQAWKVDSDAVYAALREMRQALGALALEVDWPGGRPEVKDALG